MTASLALALALTALPTLRLAPEAARPGDAVLVIVEGNHDAAPPRGTVADRPLRFYPSHEGWRALVALPLETAPGKAPVDVSFLEATLHADLVIVEPRFPSRALTLPQKFLEPPRSVRKRIEADRAAFARAFDQPFVSPLFDRIALPLNAGFTGRFGDQRLENGTHVSVHYGLDLDGSLGTPVFAAADGVVTLARACYQSGNSVVLSHGADTFTTYFHLSRIDVKPGARVRRGERLGLVGATGRVTGPHLHFAAKVDGLYVDPESLILIDFETGTASPRGPRQPAAPDSASQDGSPATHKAPSEANATPEQPGEVTKAAAPRE